MYTRLLFLFALLLLFQEACSDQDSPPKRHGPILCDSKLLSEYTHEDYMSCLFNGLPRKVSIIGDAGGLPLPFDGISYFLLKDADLNEKPFELSQVGRFECNEALIGFLSSRDSDFQNAEFGNFETALTCDTTFTNGLGDVYSYGHYDSDYRFDYASHSFSGLDLFAERTRAGLVYIDSIDTSDRFSTWAPTYYLRTDAIPGILFKCQVDM